MKIPVAIRLEVDKGLMVTAWAGVGTSFGTGVISASYQADGHRLGIKKAKKLAIDGVKRRFSSLWDRALKDCGCEETPYKFVRSK